MGYKMPFSQYKACQKMSKNEFGRWLEVFWREAEKQGYQRACDEVPDGSIIINPKDSIVVQWSEDQFRAMLLSVSGVGPKLADKIIDQVYMEYDPDNGQNHGEILSNSGLNEVG